MTALPSAPPTLPPPPRRIAAVFHDAGRAGAELVLLHHLNALHADGAAITAVLPRKGPLADALQPIAETIVYHPAPWWIRLQGSRTHARAWDDTARGGLSRRLDRSVDTLAHLFSAAKPDCILTAASVLLSPSLAARRLHLPCLQFIHEWPGAQPAAAPTAAAADPAPGESHRWDSPLAWNDALELLRAVNHRLIWSSPACALAWHNPALPFRATPQELAAAWQHRQTAQPTEAFLPHPIDLTPYADAALPIRTAPAPNTPLRLTCIATWSWRKGLDLLPPLLNRLHAAKRAFHLTLIGHPPRDNFTRRLRRQLAQAPWADQVTCQPYADNLPALFAATDLLIHPAREDTSPLILAHALAAGVPILASDLPGIRELLCGYNPARPPHGTLLPPADLPAWTGALSAWPHSPGAESPTGSETDRGRARDLARETFDAPQVHRGLLTLIAAATHAAAQAPADAANLAQTVRAKLAATHEHTAGAALWAFRDEAVDFSRGLIARLRV